MRPRLLRETSLAMCVMNAAGFILIDPAAGSVAVQAAFFGVIVGLTYVVIWFYWVGKNWVRILVMLGAILALFNVDFIGSAHALAATLIVVEAIFGAFMLWWLNLQAVQAFFKGEGG